MLDACGDIYGRDVEFAFLERLRGEQRFDGLEALEAQIARDVEIARERLAAAAADRAARAGPGG